MAFGFWTANEEKGRKKVFASLLQIQTQNELSRQRERKELVDKLIPSLPNKMNRVEVTNFLRLLYQTGKLHDHLETIATADDDEEI